MHLHTAIQHTLLSARLFTTDAPFSPPEMISAGEDLYASPIASINMLLIHNGAISAYRTELCFSLTVSG